jgi:hypothetical protein
LGKDSETLIGDHIVDKKAIDNQNYKKWAQEAFEIGESFVYEGIKIEAYRFNLIII